MSRRRAAALRAARARAMPSSLFGVLLAGCLCSGCSYSFSRSSLPSYIQTIAIPVLKNSTSEPGLQDEMTDAISRQFFADSSLRVVPVIRSPPTAGGRADGGDR